MRLASGVSALICGLGVAALVSVVAVPVVGGSASQSKLRWLTLSVGGASSLRMTSPAGAIVMVVGDSVATNDIQGATVQFDNVDAVDESEPASPHVTVEARNPASGAWRTAGGPNGATILVDVDAVLENDRSCQAGDIVTLDKRTTQSWKLAWTPLSGGDSCALVFRRVAEDGKPSRPQH